MCNSIYFMKQLLGIQYCHILPLTEESGYHWEDAKGLIAISSYKIYKESVSKMLIVLIAVKKIAIDYYS